MGENPSCHNGLKTTIIIAHVYNIFQLQKKRKVGVGSNIAQNHSSNP